MKAPQGRDVAYFDGLSAYLQGGIEQVEGWIEPISAVYIAYLSLEQVRLGLVGDVAEIGVHHGRLFLLLANAITSSETAHAIDVFDDQEKNIDQSGHGNRQVFERNVRHFAPTANVNIIQESSLDLDKTGFTDREIRMFSIDGGHTAAITRNDLQVAEKCLVDGGIVVLDDVLNPHWLGVVSGLADYLRTGGTLVPFAVSPNKVYLTSNIDHAEKYRGVMATAFPLSQEKVNIEFFGSCVDYYGYHPYYEPNGGTGVRRQRDDLQREVESLKASLAEANKRLTEN
ncbi:class I SAM-dependent methyltransferase [Paraburkholderia phenoliruptrix]|uniref:class I SAM-dependent methyltransferase n=1 Tax=Paraburkholderia phenoliruptrix TaxID=252970 RepID=UPI0028699EF7|nr:class I SAM-dependent methyltransferase [Paraburkholderia phenoliruptrix]WMY07506.1 class I SAM-dependent methyltransferase [Paraburkholderia phenoliruptrix]